MRGLLSVCSSHDEPGLRASGGTRHPAVVALTSCYQVCVICVYTAGHGAFSDERTWVACCHGRQMTALLLGCQLCRRIATPPALRLHYSAMPVYFSLEGLPA